MTRASAILIVLALAALAAADHICRPATGTAGILHFTFGDRAEEGHTLASVIYRFENGDLTATNWTWVEIGEGKVIRHPFNATWIIVAGDRHVTLLNPDTQASTRLDSPVTASSVAIVDRWLWVADRADASRFAAFQIKEDGTLSQATWAAAPTGFDFSNVTLLGGDESLFYFTHGHGDVRGSLGRLAVATSGSDDMTNITLTATVLASDVSFMSGSFDRFTDSLVFCDNQGRLVQVREDGTVWANISGSWSADDASATFMCRKVSSDGNGHFFLLGDSGILFFDFSSWDVTRPLEWMAANFVHKTLADLRAVGDMSGIVFTETTTIGDWIAYTNPQWRVCEVTPTPTPGDNNGTSVQCGGWDCPPGDRCCGERCYNPLTHDCVDGNYLCPLGFSRCGLHCYLPSQGLYHCCGAPITGELRQRIHPCDNQGPIAVDSSTAPIGATGAMSSTAAEGLVSSTGATGAGGMVPPTDDGASTADGGMVPPTDDGASTADDGVEPDDGVVPATGGDRSTGDDVLA